VSTREILLLANFGPLTAQIGSGVWGTPANFSTGSGRQPNFAALNRGWHLYLAGRPSRWVLAHILVLCYIRPRR